LSDASRLPTQCPEGVCRSEAPYPRREASGHRSDRPGVEIVPRSGRGGRLRSDRRLTVHGFPSVDRRMGGAESSPGRRGPCCGTRWPRGRMRDGGRARPRARADQHRRPHGLAGTRHRHGPRPVRGAASSLVFLAGLQLSLLTEQTDTYFAWTIAPPLTAAFLGAAYWAAVPVELIAARETVWAKARVAVPAIWLFTTLTLVATLVHFDRFHFSSPMASAQGAAWFWLAIYAGVPVAMLLIGWLQIRAPGGDPPRGSPAPTWMRVLVL